LTAISPLTSSSRTPGGSSPSARNCRAVILIVLTDICRHYSRDFAIPSTPVDAVHFPLLAKSAAQEFSMIRQILLLSFVLGTPVLAAPPKAQLVPWTASIDPPKERIEYAKDIRLTLPAKDVGVRFIAANVDRNGTYLVVGLMSGGP